MDVCGSVFTLSIPIGRDEYAENEIMSEQQLSLTSDGPNGYQQREQLFISNPLNDRCVLIVEDDIDIQDILHQELRWCRSSRDARAKVARFGNNRLHDAK